MASKKRAQKTYSYAEYVQKFRPRSIRKEEEEEEERKEPFERGKLILNKKERSLESVDSRPKES